MAIPTELQQDAVFFLQPSPLEGGRRRSRLALIMLAAFMTWCQSLSILVHKLLVADDTY